MMAGGAIGAADQDRPKERAHDKTAKAISGHRRHIRQTVGLPNLISTNRVKLVSHDGRQLQKFANVAGFKQEILIDQKLVGAIRDKVLAAAQGKWWNPGLLIGKGCATR